MGNMIPPFWKRLPEFFLYPFKPQPLAFILILAGLTVYLGNSFFFGVITMVVMIKYAFAVLEQTAKGKLTPPPITFSLLNDDLGQVFKQLAILIVVMFIAPGFILQSFGQGAMILFWMMAILCLPAMIMALVATDSLVHALNPIVFGGIIVRIGGNYFLMYLFLFFLLQAPGVFAGQVAGFLPGWLTWFIYAAAKNYYMVMVYNLMGYTLLQYHEEIGFEVEYDEAIGGQSPAANSPHAMLLGEVDMLVKEGKLDEAIALVSEDTGGEISDLKLAAKYYNLLKFRKAREELLEYGVLYLDLLADNNKKDEAAGVYRECLGVDKSFTPRPDTLFKMGKWLAWDKEPKLALSLLIKFTKTYPDHPLLPEVYFFLAKFLHTRMKEQEKARQVLTHLIKKFSGHPAAESAEKYARQLA
jgi:tetratricopeptide (TPR) repeat protein